MADPILTEDGQDRFEHLSTISTSLFSAYEETGGEDTEILNDAITAGQLVLDAPVPGRADLAEAHSELASMLKARFDTIRQDDDLEQSNIHARRALSLLGPDDPRYVFAQHNLGLGLWAWYNLKTDCAALAESIALPRPHFLDQQPRRQLLVPAIENSPSTHSDMGSLCTALSTLLRTRYDADRRLPDLMQAISWTQRATTDVCRDSYQWATYQRSLRIQKLILWEVDGLHNAELIADALDSLKYSANSAHASPLGKIEAIRAAIKGLALGENWPAARDLAVEALVLLPVVCGRYRTLEYETLRLRASREVMAHLSPAVRERLLDDRKMAVREIEQCVDRIRRCKSYENFLRAPTADGMMRWTNDGPVVVVNVTDIGADAVIISENRRIHLPLPGMAASSAPESIRFKLKKFMRRRGGRDGIGRDVTAEDADDENPDASWVSWLWENCVGPVLEDLRGIGFLQDLAHPLRTWWVGSGIASALPFHAARPSTADSVQSVDAQ
ncbi:Fc.00g023820.m01.CDS01 [Cosmosporella sp. VM-42]